MLGMQVRWWMLVPGNNFHPADLVSKAEQGYILDYPKRGARARPIWREMIYFAALFQHLVSLQTADTILRHRHLEDVTETFVHPLVLRNDKETELNFLKVKTANAMIQMKKYR